MRKIYYIEQTDEDYSIQEAIEEIFDNFSLEGFNNFTLLEEKHRFVTSFEEAQKGFTDDWTYLIIIEFTLSEDDLVELLLSDDPPLPKPTNAWYYQFDSNTQKIKEISKTLITFI